MKAMMNPRAQAENSPSLQKRQDSSKHLQAANQSAMQYRQATSSMPPAQQSSAGNKESRLKFQSEQEQQALNNYTHSAAAASNTRQSHNYSS
jgi:hypothetical protein